MVDIKDIQEKVNRAVHFKRDGKYERACKIYEKLETQLPNDPTILKSWAKVVALQGKYERAAEMFARAAVMFDKIDYPEQSEICKSHFINLKKLDKNSAKFQMYLKAIKG